MATLLPDSGVLDYFESIMKNFIVDRLSSTKDWWNACIPPEIRSDALERYEFAQKTNDVLNKPTYDKVDYLSFDSYGKIMLRKDNWKNYFEAVFIDKTIFDYKMRIIQSLRNDIRHGRPIDKVNSLRLRIHCYDVLSQIHETGPSEGGQRSILAEKLGLD